MTKAARYSLIASICLAKGYVPALQGVTQPGRADAREEIALSVSTEDCKAMRDNDLRDGDLPVVQGSSLRFDSIKLRGEREDEILLSPRERAELRADLLAYKIKQDLSAPRNPFALAMI